MKNKVIIDGRNVLNVREWEDAGWTLAALGRKFEPSLNVVGLNAAF